MKIAFDSAQISFQQEMRAYFAAFAATERSAAREGHDPAGYRAMIRRLGADGWLGIGLPRAYGGLERSTIDQMIFADEAEIAGITLPHLTISTVAPMLVEFATEAQKQRYLPGVVTGEILFSIGYTEAQSGSDLASLSCAAVRDGDSYVINGEKLYTSRITTADFVWLAVRTDASARHRGISIVLVPTDAPGFSTTPIHIFGHVPTSITRYQDVRVPVDNLIGTEGGGWQLITSQLNRERVSAFTGAKLQSLYEQTVAWAREAVMADGRRAIDVEWIQRNLAIVKARSAFSMQFAAKLCGDYDAGALGPAEAAMNKIFSTENGLDGYRLLIEVLRTEAQVPAASGHAGLAEHVQQVYDGALLRVFGGGTNDILRGFVASSAQRLLQQPL